MPAEGAIVASVADRLERVLAREAPVEGIRPVPLERRTLSGWDLAILWGDLSVGLLVVVTGALLVTALLGVVVIPGDALLTTVASFASPHLPVALTLFASPLVYEAIHW